MPEAGEEMFLERYCLKCGYEICKEGDVCTMYEGKKLCQCDKSTIAKPKKMKSKPQGCGTKRYFPDRIGIPGSTHVCGDGWLCPSCKPLGCDRTFENDGYICKCGLTKIYDKHDKGTIWFCKSCQKQERK